MAVDHIRYDVLTQQALRGVVRSVLIDAARNGLPGEHHFYISFDTGGEGVRMSQRLREQYPAEMTIILQHQFWDLIVGEDGFEVGLSFGGVPERIGIPFAAVKGFFDPSVQFGLQFEMAEGDTAPSAETESSPSLAGATPPATPDARAGSGERGKAALPLPANPVTQAPAAPDHAMADPASEKTVSGAEVVRLDRFRKK
jgi:hypothetical protein